MKLDQLMNLSVLWLSVFLFASCQQRDRQPEVQEVSEQPVVLTVEERRANIKSDLKTVKAELTGNGEYNCCVQPACDWCLLHEGNCKCYDNIKANKEVCPGCGLGWHNGKGAVEGIKVSQVKWNITHEHSAGGHKH